MLQRLSLEDLHRLLQIEPGAATGDSRETAARDASSPPEASPSAAAAAAGGSKPGSPGEEGPEAAATARGTTESSLGDIDQAAAAAAADSQAAAAAAGEGKTNARLWALLWGVRGPLKEGDEEEAAWRRVQQAADEDRAEALDTALGDFLTDSDLALVEQQQQQQQQQLQQQQQQQQHEIPCRRQSKRKAPVGFKDIREEP